MGKISPVAAKYIIKAKIRAKGVVEKPDIIGAVFGQTEGLLGSDMELRELQKSGRVGRIEVRISNKGGKTRGTIEIPSSMDKAETAVIAAALETIERIGPCSAKVKAVSVEDVREKKRSYIMDRAKHILEDMLMTGPDSQELLGEVTESVRKAEMVTYGRKRLPAGPDIRDSDDIIVVEGRADVLNLLKHGFKNAIAMQGNTIPKELLNLAKRKEVTLFVDGDRGGDLIIKEFLMASDIDYVAKAPDGKEVEELVQKEIHKALRSREKADKVRKDTNVKLEGKRKSRKGKSRKKKSDKSKKSGKSKGRGGRKRSRRKSGRSKSEALGKMSKKEKENYGKLLDDLVGTRGAYLMKEGETLGKVPTVELGRYLDIMKADTLVMDGKVTDDIAKVCSRHDVELIVAKESDTSVRGVPIVTKGDLK